MSNALDHLDRGGPAARAAAATTARVLRRRVLRRRVLGRHLLGRHLLGRHLLGLGLIGLGLLAAGCGGPGAAGSAGSHSGTTAASAGRLMAEGIAYAGCMRAHGISDFPDPSPSAGGGVAWQLQGGAGSDLNPRQPSFAAAATACRSLLPGEGRTPPASATRLAAEVRWAQCMRAHGLPGFPDPDAAGAFDSSKFDSTSPAFRAASTACQSLEPSGSMSAVPGHGSRS